MFRKSSKLTFFFTNELETPQNSPQRLRKVVFPSGETANGTFKLFLFPKMSDGNPSWHVFKELKLKMICSVLLNA